MRNIYIKDIKFAFKLGVQLANRGSIVRLSDGCRNVPTLLQKFLGEG